MMEKRQSCIPVWPVAGMTRSEQTSARTWKRDVAQCHDERCWVESSFHSFHSCVTCRTVHRRWWLLLKLRPCRLSESSASEDAENTPDPTKRKTGWESSQRIKIRPAVKCYKHPFSTLKNFSKAKTHLIFPRNHLQDKHCISQSYVQSVS